MKIVILTSTGNYHVPVFLSRLFEQCPGDEFRVLVSGRTRSGGPLALLKKYGLLYTTLRVLERLSYGRRLNAEQRTGLPLARRHYLLLDEVTGHYRVRRDAVADINDDAQLSELDAFAPDLIVSLCFDQILKARVLGVGRHAPINLHPSLLPAYGGTSPTFWVMARGESETGITLHEMTEQVDGGRILSQQRVPIESAETQFELYRRCMLAGLAPLVTYLDSLRSGGGFTPEVVNQGLQPSYFSYPKGADLRAFLRRGRRFI